MSDPSGRLNPVENGSDQQHLLNPAEQDKQINKNNVCRDFLKHVCRRGKRCKFLHPDELEQTEEPFNFCIDFQNRGCVRQNCRFIHAAEELVSEYMTTREVTLPLARCIVAVSTGNTIAGIPLCGEFQDGICTRTGCRYWHINADEERTRRATQPVARVSDHTVNGYGVGVKRPIDLLENSPYAKMSRLNDYGMTAHPSHVMDLERSNAELRKEVDMLRFQLRNERERYQDLYSLFRQLVGFGTVRLQAPQPPHPGQLPQTAGATPSESFPPVGGYKPPPPAPEWQGQTPSKW